MVPPLKSKATNRSGKEDMNDINEKFPWTMNRCSGLDSIYNVIRVRCQKIASCYDHKFTKGNAKSSAYTEMRCSSFSEALESLRLLTEVSELDDLHHLSSKRPALTLLTVRCSSCIRGAQRLSAGCITWSLSKGALDGSRGVSVWLLADYLLRPYCPRFA